MAHTLIVGQTESGKTLLARALAKRYKEQGYKVIVLDSAWNDWEAADIQTADQDEFLRIAIHSRRCALFVDEGGEVVGTYQKALNVVATKMRHLGHFATFIAQGPKMINKTVRTQCSNCGVFNLWRDDCFELAKEFNNTELQNAANLAQGEFIWCSRFGPTMRDNVFHYYPPLSKAGT